MLLSFESSVLNLDGFALTLCKLYYILYIVYDILYIGHTCYGRSHLLKSLEDNDRSGV